MNDTEDPIPYCTLAYSEDIKRRRCGITRDCSTCGWFEFEARLRQEKLDMFGLSVDERTGLRMLKVPAPKFN